MDSYYIDIKENEKTDLLRIVQEHLFDDYNLIPALNDGWVERKFEYIIQCSIPFLRDQLQFKVFNTREEAEKEIKKYKWYYRFFMKVWECESV